MLSSHSGSPVSEGSRPSSSITRSSRESFVSELETLPPECDYLNELNEEVLDIEDVSEDESDIISVKNQALMNIDEGCAQKIVPVQKEEQESEIEAKIRKGLEKVKKLDKILQEKTEYEKEVKQERRDLEREFQSQVSKLIQEKGADKVCGSQQLLYLCASADRPEDISEMDELVEPIFPTQIDIEYYKERSDNSPPRDIEHKEAVSENDVKENKQKKGKNFVKRNIQLAAHAQDTVLLTDEEKTRLDELLADDSDLLMVENPFSSNTLTTLTGFQFSQEEQTALQNIDAQLKELIPSEEFVLGVGDSNSSEKSFLTYSKFSLSVDGDNNEDIYIRDAKCGEKVLQQGGEERHDICRMRDIDARLKQLQCTDDEDKSVSPRMDPDMLRKLLDINSRLTSDSVSICESLRSKSSVYDGDNLTSGEELCTA